MGGFGLRGSVKGGFWYGDPRARGKGLTAWFLSNFISLYLKFDL